MDSPSPGVDHVDSFVAVFSIGLEVALWGDG